MSSLFSSQGVVGSMAPKTQTISLEAGTPGRVGLRDTYHKHISEAMTRLKTQHPDLSPKEIIAMARTEC